MKTNEIYLLHKQKFPKELLQELNLTENNFLCLSILEVFEENNKIASVNKILIGVYQKTEKIIKRRKIVSFLYKMYKAGILKKENKKGVYSLI